MGNFETGNGQELEDCDRYPGAVAFDYNKWTEGKERFYLKYQRYANKKYGKIGKIGIFRQGQFNQIQQQQQQRQQIQQVHTDERTESISRIPYYLV